MKAGAVIATTLCLGLPVGASAATRAYAPVDRPGPALAVPEAQLAKNLVCQPGVNGAIREPVLLVPGTTLTPSANFSWNYERAFSALKVPYCTVELPDAAMGDIQTAAEYVVYAIRRVHDLSGRKVGILGYSQGGMVPRWALRFWPDTRALVDDDIGLDASNHGTLTAEDCNTTASCPAAFWQQRASALFIAALNSGQETFPGVSYTEIFSHTDEIVVPNLDQTGSSSVHGGGGAITNVAVQEICPTDASDHLAMGTYDAVGYALATDALTHVGPADPKRIDPTVCAQPFQPGVDPATFPTTYAAYLAAIAAGDSGAKQVPAEPELKCYVFADCPSAMQHVAGTKKRAAAKRRANAHREHRRRHQRRRHATVRRSPRFTG